MHDEAFNTLGKTLEGIGKFMMGVQEGLQEVKEEMKGVRAGLQRVDAVRKELQRVDSKIDTVKRELTGYLNGVLVEVVGMVSEPMNKEDSEQLVNGVTKT